MCREGYSSCLVCVCVCVCVCVRACVRACVPACLPACVLPACLPACLSVSVSVSVSVCLCLSLSLCLCLCLCLSVCMSVRTRYLLAVRAIRSITKDAIVLSVRFAAILKKAFFLKLSYSKVRAFFTHLGRGGHL